MSQRSTAGLGSYGRGHEDQSCVCQHLAHALRRALSSLTRQQERPLGFLKSVSNLLTFQLVSCA
jgi:hypothetical protein